MSVLDELEWVTREGSADDATLIPEPGLDAATIDAVERRVGAPLPADLRCLLGACHGIRGWSGRSSSRAPWASRWRTRSRTGCRSSAITPATSGSSTHDHPRKRRRSSTPSRSAGVRLAVRGMAAFRGAAAQVRLAGAIVARREHDDGVLVCGGRIRHPEPGRRPPGRRTHRAGLRRRPHRGLVDHRRADGDARHGLLWGRCGYPAGCDASERSACSPVGLGAQDGPPLAAVRPVTPSWTTCTNIIGRCMAARSAT